MDIKQAIHSLLDGKPISSDEAECVMKCIMTGGATFGQMGAYLGMLAVRGETPEVVAGSAKAMRSVMTVLPTSTPVIDIVGTGGDEAFTFNISTASGFVASAIGARVAKHGNRSVSSKCGAADVFERLGCKIEMTPEECAKLLDEVGMCFMFAPVYHSSMRYAAPVRREVGIRTVFNVLGPLANPANAEYILLGAYSEEVSALMAEALLKLGVKHAFTVHSRDGLDELSICAPTDVHEVAGGKMRTLTLNARDYGLSPCDPKDLLGGDAAVNAEIVRAILCGEDTGAKRDIVIFNAAVAKYLYESTELMPDYNQIIAENVKIARAALESGKVKAFYENYIARASV